MDDIARSIGYFVLSGAILFAICGVIALIAVKLDWDVGGGNQSKLSKVLWSIAGILFLVWLTLGYLAE